MAQGRFAMCYLALQVRQVDGVVIGEGEMADAGGCEVHRGWRAESAHTGDQHAGGQQPLLAGDIKLRQHDLAAVAQQLIVVHACCPNVTRGSEARSFSVSMPSNPASRNNARTGSAWS